VADLMLDALGQAPDRSAALTRFLGSVTPDDTDHMRRALGSDLTPAPEPAVQPGPRAARPAAARPAAAGPAAAGPAAAGPAASGPAAAGPGEPGH
jgi:hypothetical protein